MVAHGFHNDTWMRGGLHYYQKISQFMNCPPAAPLATAGPVPQPLALPLVHPPLGCPAMAKQAPAGAGGGEATRVDTGEGLKN